MIFLEVDSVQRYWSELQALELHHRYKHVRLTPIKKNPTGVRNVFSMIPPVYSGILVNSLMQF